MDSRLLGFPRSVWGGMEPHGSVSVRSNTDGGRLKCEVNAGHASGMKTGVYPGLRGRERSWRPRVRVRGLLSPQQHGKRAHLGGTLTVPSDLGPWRRCMCDRWEHGRRNGAPCANKQTSMHHTVNTSTRAHATS